MWEPRSPLSCSQEADSWPTGPSPRAQLDEPTRFMLLEVYDGDVPGANAAHKETAHYAAWRDGVADWMAEPRSAAKYTVLSPAARPAWQVPPPLAAGTPEAVGQGLNGGLFVVLVRLRVKPEHVDAFMCAPTTPQAPGKQRPRLRARSRLPVQSGDAGKRGGIPQRGQGAAL